MTPRHPRVPCLDWRVRPTRHLVVCIVGQNVPIGPLTRLHRKCRGDSTGVVTVTTHRADFTVGDLARRHVEHTDGGLRCGVAVEADIGPLNRDEPTRVGQLLERYKP